MTEDDELPQVWTVEYSYSQQRFHVGELLDTLESNVDALLLDLEEVRDYVLLAVLPTKEHAESEMMKLMEQKADFAKPRPNLSDK